MNRPSNELLPGPRAYIVACACLAVACVGFALLAVYAHTPGEPGAPPQQWPDPDGLALDRGHPTLVMFAHPRCPCTRASLRELERLVAQVGGNVAGYVLCHTPAGESESWAKTGIWEAAAQIPGLRVIADPESRMARSFGVTTSGHVLLYDVSGELVFSGGITASRGHEGDNRGRDAIREFINEGRVIEREAAVYGCDLREPEGGAPLR